MAEQKKGTANPELAKAMADLRKSNAAQPHLDRRTRRRRTRAEQVREAVEDSQTQ